MESQRLGWGVGSSMRGLIFIREDEMMLPR